MEQSADVSGVPEPTPEESFGLSAVEVTKRGKIGKLQTKCGSLRRKIATLTAQYDAQYAELLALTMHCPHLHTGVGPKMIGKTEAQVRFCLVCDAVLPAVDWRSMAHLPE